MNANNIQLDADRVRKRVEQFAESYEDPQEVIDYYYQNQEQLNSVQNVVLEEQVVDWVLEQAKVEEQATDFESLMDPKPEAAAEQD